MRHRPKKKALPTEACQAEVTGLDHDGRGVARVDGKVTFIADALPGEVVRFQYSSRRRECDEGKLVEVLSPSPHRVQAACPHFGVCGGCALQHLAAEQQLAFKQNELLQALARIGGVVPEVVAPAIASAALGYRRRARLGVKRVDKKGGILIGFRERAAHFLAKLDSCIVLDPRVGLKLPAIAEFIGSLSIADAIPQIEVACGAHVALVLRVLQTPSSADCAAMAAFAFANDFEIFLQPQGLDSIRPLTPPARGLAYSPDGSGLQLTFEPSDFIQVNAAVSQAMVRQALQWLDVKAGEAVLELFAGLGNFTLPLAATGAVVTAVEGERGLIARGSKNCDSNALSVTWHLADLFKPEPKAAYLQQRYDAVLLDPPRSGAEAMMPLLPKLGAKRIVYVSCHPGTLARDAKLLAQSGYQLKMAGVMDMFPHTAHVESMALFSKK